MNPAFSQPILRLLVASALAACCGCDSDGGSGASSSSASSLESSWPRQTIQISCFAAAGGGTDTVCRLLAKTMEEELGAKINVINRPSARGGAAINYVWSRDKDGYNWCGVSESMLPASVLGITETTSKDWNFFMAAGAPGVLSVAEDSPIRTFDEFIQKAKANPDAVKVSASLTGGIWHTKMLALEAAAGVDLNYIPFNKGSQPSQMACLTGEVDAVLTSVSEQAEWIEGNQLRPLAMVEMKSFEFPGRGVIPAAGSQYPDLAKMPVSQWLGFALPKGTPSDILKIIEDAFVKVMNSNEIKEFAENRLLTLYGYYGEEANELAAQAESAWTWKLHELGVAVKSPATFNIPKPGNKTDPQ